MSFKHLRDQVTKYLIKAVDKKAFDQLKKVSEEIGDDDIYCMECREEFQGTYPTPGEHVDCPNCGAEGHGTYDCTEDMDYMIEWYPPE